MNLLLTSISAKTNLVVMFKEAAAPWGVSVYGCDVVDTCIARSQVDGFFISKLTTDRRFVEDLIAQCKAHDINLIIPTRDGDVEVLARYINSFINVGIEVVVPEIDAVQICQNKNFFNDWLIRYQYPALTIYETDKITDEDFPLFLRPISGAGSAGCRQIYSLKDIQCSSMTVLTNYIDAPEYSIDVLMDLQSKPLQAVVRRRDKVVDGEAVKSTIVNHEELTEIALQMSSFLHLVGHNLLQAFETPNGEFVFFDVNLRFGGASDLSVKAGLQSPARLLAMVYGSLKDKKAAKKPYEIAFGMQLDRSSDNPFTLPTS